jgi:hypothetical protein
MALPDAIVMEMGPTPEEEGSDPVEMHAKAFIRAQERKDPKALAMAFRAMKQACEEEYDAGTDDNDSGY